MSVDLTQMATPDFASFPVTGADRRKIVNLIFLVLCWLSTAAMLLVLVVLLSAIVWKALPIFKSRADILESTSWAKIVQGVNPGNDPDFVDDGDLLQGIFVANQLAVGGLSSQHNIQFGEDSSRVGIFSFQLNRNSADPQAFECRPADGIYSIQEILTAAGFEIDHLTAPRDSLQPASIAFIESTGSASWTTDDLDANGGLLANGKIAGVFSSQSGWKGDLIVGQPDASNFCQLVFERALLRPLDGEGVEGEMWVDLAVIDQMRPRKRLARMSGLFAVLKHNLDQPEFVPVRNRSPESEKILTGDIALGSNNGIFFVLPPAKKQGFDFGGKLNLTSNLVPDQGGILGNLVAFLTQNPKTDPNKSGIGPALAGSIWVCLGCALIALPLGIGSAVFLEEFRPKNRFMNQLLGLVQLNITNLAGVPSIVYGIVGLTAFGTMFGLFGSPNDPSFEFGVRHYHQFITEGQRVLRLPSVRGTENGESNWLEPVLVHGAPALLAGQWVSLNVIQPGEALPTDKELLSRTLLADAEGGPAPIKAWYYLQLPLGRGVLAASLTLMLVILPVIIIASQEALRAVPGTLRQGALGLGSTRWQTVRHVTLPAAIPGIMTGAILAISRAIGEAAPIIVLCGIVYITAGPQHLMDSYSVLPVQLFHWVGQPIDELSTVNWHHVVSAGILVLLVILFCFNAVAITIRHWTQRPLS